MADGPRCQRRKQANPRRNNVTNHSSAAEPSSDSDDEDRLHIVEEDSLGDVPESDANVLEANATVLTRNGEEQDALCEEGDLGPDAQKTTTRFKVKDKGGSEGVGLQDGDTPIVSPEAPEDEAQLGTSETSGHDENGVPDTFPQLLSCPYCSRGYKRYASLKEHIKYRHEKSDDNYCCSLCSYTFPHRTQLDRHMTAHKPSREQRVHVAPSSGNRKFKCSECSKAFKYKHHLKEHLRIHSGEKPYECSHCKKRFSHSGSYSSHISSKKCFGPLPVNGRPRPGAKPSPCPSPCPSPSPVASPTSPGRPLPRDKADPGKPLQEQLPVTQIKAEPTELEYKSVLLAPAVNNVAVCNGGPSLQPAQAPPPAVVQAVVLPTVGLVSPISIDLRELQSVLKLAVDGTVLRQVLQSAHQNATKEMGGGANTTATPTHSVISAISLPIVDQDGTTKIIINYSLEPSLAPAKPAPPSPAHPTQPNPAQSTQPNHALPTQPSPTLLAVPNHTLPTQTSPTQPAPPSQAHLTQPGPTQNTALNHAQPMQPSPAQPAPPNHAQQTRPSPAQPVPPNHAQPTQKSPTQPAQPSPAKPSQLSPILPKSTDHGHPSPTQLPQPSHTQKLCSAPPAMEKQTPPTALEKVDMPPQDPTQKAEQIKKVEPLGSNGAGLTDREGTCLLCDSCPGGLDALHALKHCSSDSKDPPTANGEQDPEHHTPESLALSALLSDGVLGRPPLRNLLSLLKAYFALNAEPTAAELTDISQSVSLPPDVVKRWFHKMQSEQITVGGPIGKEGQPGPAQSPSASEGSGAKTNLPADSTSSLLLTESDTVDAQSGAPLAPPDLVIVKTEEEEEGDGQAEPLDLSLPRRPEGVGPVEQQGGVYAEQEEPLNLSTGRKESQPPAQMLTQTLAQLKTGDTIFVTPNSNPVSIVAAQLPTIVAISDRTALPCLRAVTAVTTNKQTILIPQLTYTYTTATTATPAKPVAAARDTSPHGNSPQDERQDTGSEGPEEQNDCDSAPPRRKMRKTESGMYACDLCDKIFQKSSSLLRHKYEHTGKRPHECGVCRKAFKHKHHLIEHTRLHSGEKPYQCDKCGKRFSHSGSYSQHMNHRYSYCKRETHRGGAAPPTDGTPPAQPDSDEREEDSEEEEVDEEGMSEDEIQVVQVGEEGEDSDEEWREDDPEEEGEGSGEGPKQEGDELENSEQGLDKDGEGLDKDGLGLEQVGEGLEQEVGNVLGRGKVGEDEAVLGGDAQVEEVTVETEDSMELEQMGGEEGHMSASSEGDRNVPEDTDGK